MNEFIEVPVNKMSLAKRKLIHGVGINDADYLIIRIIDGKQQICPYYRTWSDIIDRCYNPKYHITRPTYIGCSICEEWRTFSNFKVWMMTQDWEGKQLDKDLLVSGNKIYSPRTCLFVPPAINSLMNGNAASRGKYAIGASWHKPTGKYIAYCCISGKNKYLGLHLSEEDAHQAYIAFKRELIIITANKETDLKLKDALLRIAHNL